MRVRRDGDAGQATVLVLVVVVVVLVAMVATARFGARVVAREQAQVAADAAALAGTTGGRQSANRLAHLNGAVLVSFAATGEVVVVSVRVGDATATAQATRAP